MPMKTATITATTTYILPILRIKSESCAIAGWSHSNCKSKPNTHFCFMVFILARQNSRYFFNSASVLSEYYSVF